ncbi:kanadaptin isoform X1 [Nasonia vitripennis]|uniref:FHA domain-containing protein n=1 Tax=Nasonia vitripennis TaxID=7425 RepID=A0A7M7GBT0_NASVI|nr:kanadaptin isoform X1 [Nasonia vitripennis]
MQENSERVCLPMEKMELDRTNNVPDDKATVTSNASLNNSSKDTFKKPVLLIGPRKGHPTKVRTLTQEDAVTDKDKHPEEQSVNIKSEVLPVIHKPNKPDIIVESPKEKTTVPYVEPTWSGPPENGYELEVLKSGLILEVIDLTDKNYHVVGRLPNCDMSMAHPTISRYHAVFQYRANGDEKNGKGMYVYDLGSTHGTFWNGNRIRPKVYVRVQGGHMIRFGCSQRKFIVKAPPCDQEEESDLSVTELKEMRKRELNEREEAEKLRLLQEEEEERLRKEKEENEGIDWGMGEDADEETDLTENPYAQTNNEELFLDDPKKTLRGWFEREGYDLQYQTEDKGIGKFLCWVDLPIDNTAGRTVRAEALVAGKKKEAVIQCALEACRVLDRYGLLRQANHEARKRKTRNWEEEDYYDSDEDNFLDRTGTVEKKREQRMRMAGKLDTKAETYDSLLEKHSKVAEKITTIEHTIALHKSKQDELNDSNEDALDAFMSTLDSAALDKTEIRKMKIELLNLRKEEMQLLKLINIAKPANLPPLKPHVPTIAKKSKQDYKDLKSVIGCKKSIKISKKKCEALSKSAEEDENIEQSENDEVNDRLQDIKENDETKTDAKNIEENESLKSKTTITEHISKSDSEAEEEVEKDNLKRKKRNQKRNQQRMEKATKKLQKGYDEDEFREDYSTWVPPENQSGDGKTSLNEKFGY